MSSESTSNPVVLADIAGLLDGHVTVFDNHFLGYPTVPILTSGSLIDDNEILKYITNLKLNLNPEANPEVDTNIIITRNTLNELMNNIINCGTNASTQVLKNKELFKSIVTLTLCNSSIVQGLALKALSIIVILNYKEFRHEKYSELVEYFIKQCSKFIINSEKHFLTEINCLMQCNCGIQFRSCSAMLLLCSLCSCSYDIKKILANSELLIKSLNVHTIIPNAQMIHDSSLWLIFKIFKNMPEFVNKFWDINNYFQIRIIDILKSGASSTKICALNVMSIIFTDKEIQIPSVDELEIADALCNLFMDDTFLINKFILILVMRTIGEFTKQNISVQNFINNYNDGAVILKLLNYIDPDVSSVNEIEISSPIICNALSSLTQIINLNTDNVSLFTENNGMSIIIKLLSKIYLSSHASDIDIIGNTCSLLISCLRNPENQPIIATHDMMKIMVHLMDSEPSRIKEMVYNIIRIIIGNNPEIKKSIAINPITNEIIPKLLKLLDQTNTQIITPVMIEQSTACLATLIKNEPSNINSFIINYNFEKLIAIFQQNNNLYIIKNGLQIVIQLTNMSTDLHDENQFKLRLGQHAKFCGNIIILTRLLNDPIHKIIKSGAIILLSKIGIAINSVASLKTQSGLIALRQFIPFTVQSSRESNTVVPSIDSCASVCSSASSSASPSTNKRSRSETKKLSSCDSKKKVKHDSDTHVDTNIDISCRICFEDPTDDTYETSERVFLPCFHSYHTECITGWIRAGNDECPLCKIFMLIK